MTNSLKLIVALSIATAAAACGAPQEGREISLTPLEQARAVDVIQRALARRDITDTETTVDATLANGTEVAVDVWVPSVRAGYVFLNEQDRIGLGPIPEAAAGSELHAVLATVEGHEGHVAVLILIDEDYGYLLNPRAEDRNPDEATIEYVESRLGRDAQDFAQALLNSRAGDDD